MMVSFSLLIMAYFTLSNSSNVDFYEVKTSGIQKVKNYYGEELNALVLKVEELSVWGKMRLKRGCKKYMKKPGCITST